MFHFTHNDIYRRQYATSIAIERTNNSSSTASVNSSGNPSTISNSSTRDSSLRHNPYVGMFNAKGQLLGHDSAATTNVMVESRNNPMVGVFRHSPSIFTPAHLGLKGIIYKDQTPKPPLLSQLQVPRDRNNVQGLSKRNFVTNLRQIPVKVFSASSVASRSSAPSVVDARTNTEPVQASVDINIHPRSINSQSDDVTNGSSNNGSKARNDDDAPVCSICLDAYVDGDEILTLACSHCFHSECVSKWFFHGCLNNADLNSSFSCPECRQDHITLSEATSHCSNDRCSTSTNDMAMSFLQIGQKLYQDGGYDFLSDEGSDTRSTAGSKHMPGTGGRLTRIPLSPVRQRATSSSSTSSFQQLRSSKTNSANNSKCSQPMVAVTIDNAYILDKTTEARPPPAILFEEQELEQQLDQDRDDCSVSWSTYSDCGYALKDSEK